MVRHLFRRLRKSDRGAAMVEFAFVVLAFLAIIFGIIEFAWIFHGYITLTGAAREGARLAVVMEALDEAAVKNAVKSHARFFQLTDSDIIISPAGFDEEREVAVTGDLNLLIGLPPLYNTISLTARATMRQER